MTPPPSEVGNSSLYPEHLHAWPRHVISLHTKPLISWPRHVTSLHTKPLNASHYLTEARDIISYLTEARDIISQPIVTQRVQSVSPVEYQSTRQVMNEADFEKYARRKTLQR